MARPGETGRDHGLQPRCGDRLFGGRKEARRCRPPENRPVSFRGGGASALPGTERPPDRDLSTRLCRLPARAHTPGRESPKPTHPGERPHEVVDVDVGLLRVDVRSDPKEVLLDRGNGSELEQGQCMSGEISGSSRSFSKATVFLKQDKQALSMTGQVEKGGKSLPRGNFRNCCVQHPKGAGRCPREGAGSPVSEGADPRLPPCGLQRLCPAMSTRCPRRRPATGHLLRAQPWRKPGWVASALRIHRDVCYPTGRGEPWAPAQLRRNQSPCEL